jgi:hypothetical protein
LGEVAQELRRVLYKTQRSFSESNARLPESAWSEISPVVVEWAEDIHNEIGMWQTVEAYQQQVFGTPLPFLVQPDAASEISGFDPRRIQYLLWSLWECSAPGVYLSPTHPSLKLLSEATSQFLTERFAPIPKDSGVKQFLAGSNEYGWDVKMKLFWLGLNSYLFRFLFFKHVTERRLAPNVTTKDDFVCQRCTLWSGLGAIDVLAGALDVPESDRATLRTWHEQHTSFYRILSRQQKAGVVESLVARNVVNGRDYTIRMNAPECPFEPDMIVFGSLTPWRGEWYWSGEQRSYGKPPEGDEENLRKLMLESSSRLSYRFRPDLEAKALAATHTMHRTFVDFYGNDLKVFTDGSELVAAEQERMNRIRAEGGPTLNLDFPDEFLRHKEGFGLFFNPEEGVVITTGFNLMQSGLAKKGKDLTEEEVVAIRHLLTVDLVSPAFIRRLVAEHGGESISRAFSMSEFPTDFVVEFLLRRHKGQFYRKRYPSLSVAHSEEAGLV